MLNIDKRGRLDDEIFAYQANKDGEVLIFWQGKQVMILKGDKARKLLAKVENADPHAVQLALAKVTGHFKHGNER